MLDKLGHIETLTHEQYSALGRARRGM